VCYNPGVKHLSSVVLALLVVAGCTAGPRAGRDAPEPGIGPAYTSLAPPPEIDALAADFRGSCAFARPPGGAADYAVRVRVLTPGVVSVRSSAEFHAGDRTNRIGELEPGTLLAAAGPLAVGSGEGVGYAVLVRDGDGHVCRGYVPRASVEVVPGR
jgi:hypothetical protein